MDVVLLSRIQFALTIGFHYIYPPLSIGLGVALVIMEATWLRTRNRVFLDMTKFWARIFGLIFAIGVATGIVMEFEFGTNWASYSRFVGDVFGSALAAEGVFAFFLESGFLAILLFGWDKVKPGLHFFSTIMVMLGAHFSALWIIVANSWMQTPAGYHLVQTATGVRAEITDFWAMVLNPSTFDRLSHTVMGAWQAGAFFVISVGAYYLLKKRHEEFARATIKIGLIVAVVASLMQLVTGHSGAKTVARYQPAKLAAFEGIYEDGKPAAMAVLGWVDESRERVIGIKIPGMLSWLVHGDAKASITGLHAFKVEDRPPVNLVFQTYHFMVAIGMTLIVLAVAGFYLLWKGILFNNRTLLWIYVFSVLLPQMANQLGWASAEIGRQPWLVYNLMKTREGVSKTVDGGQILTSLILFTIIYVGLFVLFIYLLDDKIRKGPEESESVEEGHRA
ncbi:MAG: cytochrome ubiquinol oxidase subunit I [bacterium]